MYAGDLMTTTPAYIDCDNSILCGGGTPADPQPDVYAQLMAIIQSCPTAEGKGYRLRTDLTWEEYDLPPVEEPEELTQEEKAAAYDAIAAIYEE